jgi:phosphoglycerate dehydrogenase-like enzyme
MIILYFKKNLWSKANAVKVLIAVNNHFTKASWDCFLKAEYAKEIQNWDVIYCRNRFDIYKHFAAADICFLYGYSSFLNFNNIKPKLIYFPLSGLENLINKQIPQNIKIENPPAYSAKAIAEYCVAMAIIFSRNLHYAMFDQRNRKWNQEPILEDPFVSISTYKIGVLGVGNVGKIISEKFKKLGCHVAGFDKIAKKDIASIDQWFSGNELKDFLKHIDVLIIALNLTEETKYIIGVEELKCLGTSSFLINVSRGDMIIEKDLIRALKTKTIKGAVIDTFSKEPLDIDSAFYKLDNVIVTPHVAGNINLFVKEIQKDFLKKSLTYSRNV